MAVAHSRLQIDEPATLRAVRSARALFKEKETRDLFYKVSVFLVEASFSGAAPLTLAEALSVLLQTWNGQSYRFRQKEKSDLRPLQHLLKHEQDSLRRYRARELNGITETDCREIAELFRAFELVLGPVGAAKALHLLAPSVFPIWERAIAKAYRIHLAKAGQNGDRYWLFLQTAQSQIRRLKLRVKYKDPLKALDEYNYCKYPTRWI